jgi:hypothetical protein
LKRALTPATNPAGLGSSAAAVYAAIVMIVNATHHHAVIDPQVVIAALGAAGFLYARFKVTPVADPKDGNGQPLVAATAVPAVTVNATATPGAEIGRQIIAAMQAYEGRPRGGYASGGNVAPGFSPVPPVSDSPEKTLIPPAAAAAEQPPAAAGPAEPAVPE